jgi:DNA-directed RNA polymerase specialized sigma24 family protein
MSIEPADLPSELLRATALGDQIAFAELYRLTSAKLYAIASRMLRNADAASEALQEAFRLRDRAALARLSTSRLCEPQPPKRF